MSNRDGEEPDWTRSRSLSRRHALALGAATMGGLAGCSSVSDLGETSTTDTPDGDSGPERTITVTDQSIDSVEFDALLPDSLRERDEVEFTVRAYTSPNLDRGNWSQVGEAAVTQTKGLETHSMDWELPLGYAQQLRFTVEMLSPDAEPEESVATVEFQSTERERQSDEESAGATIVPFYNAARDTEMVRIEPPATPSGDWAYSDPFFKTDFWFDAPDESAFDTPEVPEDEYDRDWYDYRNITMTALVRFPTYETITEFEGSDEDVPTHSPAFDWAVVNLDLDAWELVEATRWNSIATQKLESGELVYGTDSGDVESIEDYGSSIEASLDLELDASSQTTPYLAYLNFRFGGAGWDQAGTNPLLMNGGRPFSMRAADEFERAFDNPSFQTLEYQDYHKAIALQVFVGQNLFGYQTGSYVATSEETVNRWYEIGTGEKESAGNCQDATAMYGGIAVHLLDATYGVVGVQGNVGYHVMGGLVGLERPERPYDVWPDHPSPNAADAFTFETDQGTVNPVECTFPDATIGWKNSGSGDYELLSSLQHTLHQSHIPVNSDDEPDVEGKARTDRPPEVPWEVHEEFTTIDDVENFRGS